MEVDLSRLFKWSCRTYSLESFVDDYRNTFPRVVYVKGGICPDLEKETLKVGQILILQEIQREQFVVLTQSSGTEHFIPCKSPVKVELVPLDRLDEKYATVEELFVAQPDYFRVVDDIPSFDIKSGSVMKICSKQNGVYHMECEAVGKASRQEIVKLPLALHGRFLPLHDAREYLLEEVLARYPPPSKVGVRLINSSSTKSLPFSPEAQLPLGSDLKVQRMLHDDTIIATAVADEGKEVLLFPKTLGVNIVPALDVSVKSEHIWSLNCLEQTKVLNSLFAYHAGSCRLRRYNIEDLTTLSLSEPCDILPNLHEPEILQTTVCKGELEVENNSANGALTTSQTKQPRSGELFYAVQSQDRSTNTTVLQKNDTYDDALLAGSHTAPPQPGIHKIEARTLRRPEPSYSARGTLALPLGSRSLSENDVSTSIASAGDDYEYVEVFFGVPRAAPPQPKHSKTSVDNQVDHISDTLSTLAFPLGPKSLSEIDLSRNLTSEENGKKSEVQSEGTHAPTPQPSGTRNMLPLPLGCKSLSESDLHGLLAPDEGHSQFDNPISNPKTFQWVCRQKNKPLPLPPCCKRPNEGSSLGMEKTTRESSNLDEDEDAYSAMSLDIGDSEYTEMENKVCKDQTNETERWSRGKEGPNEIHGRSGSYWYAYQHFWFRQFYRAGLHDGISYVDCPMLRRRQHSDNITDKITSKSIERDNEEAGGPQCNRPFLRKKSRSEGDAFQNVFFTTNVENLDDCYIELLADADPDGTYLEPVDAISGAAELQVDGPDATNCKRKTIGVERQESHERRTSRDGDDVCDGRERCPTYSLPYQHLYPFLRGVSKSTSDGAYTEKFVPLPSWPVHIDDQSHVWVKPADETTIEDNSSTHGSEICQCPSSPTSSNGQSADKSLFFTFPPSQVQKDIWETADYPPEETGKEEGDAKNVEDKEQENIEDPCNEELISVMGEKVQIDAHGPSSSTVIAQEKAKDDGKKARVNAKVKKAQRLQKAWAQHKRIRRKVDPSSGYQENEESGSGEKKLSPAAKVYLQSDFPKGCKKDQEVEAKIKQNQDSENGKNKPPIQRFVKTKDKKTLINAKFEAELSRVMNRHARAQQNLATSKDAHISFGPNFPLSTATVPSFDEQSPKSKKAPTPIPKRKEKSPA